MELLERMLLATERKGKKGGFREPAQGG